MIKWKYVSIFIILIISYGCQKVDSTDPTIPDPLEPDPVGSTDMLYFPPIGETTWRDTSVLDWNEDKIDDLVSFLDNTNTKGFIMLVDGKLAVEEYFDDHDVDATWEWYSAVKSLIATSVGIASAEGLVDLDEKTSTYLGDNWSSLDKEKQDLIKVRNHLTMTTGLVNNISNPIQWTCIAPACMRYETDAGTRWAYHQGAYTLSQEILTSATGINFREYCRVNLQDRIGMDGNWRDVLDVRIFQSSTRSMARFGLLALNEGVWNDEVIYPKSYFDAMTDTSQDLNKSYGYLWWLNGKESFLTTGDQTLYSGPLVPNAPEDMFAALGLDDQKIYVIPSKNMVVIRCGENTGVSQFANSSFDNELWAMINDVIN